MQKAIKYLEQLIQKRVKSFFDKKPMTPNGKLPEFSIDKNTPFGKFVYGRQLSSEEFIVLCLGLVPHIFPNLLEQVIKKCLPERGAFPEMGGIRGKNFRGLLPTGETAIFLLAGTDLGKRIEAQELFSSDHFFSKRRILWLETPEKNDPPLAGQIVLNEDYASLFTLGKIVLPAFSCQFPAERLETKMTWEELVLPFQTRCQIEELAIWLEHRRILMHDWGMDRSLKPGYRALFHGPPGTGKTLTAMLIAKTYGLPIFRIDLSMVVSKYIGETEKNLANLFVKAENKDWILFFDEADALFGKRTDVRDAHDKYANQEVAYLLQRVENYDGLVILASNYKSNIDEAFLRRFQSVIYFPKPGTGERLTLWQNSFPAQVPFADDVQLPQIAQKYELSGSEIVNVVQFCCLRAAGRKNPIITNEDIMDGIRKEFEKSSRKIAH